MLKTPERKHMLQRSSLASAESWHAPCKLQCSLQTVCPFKFIGI
jgi:hypothetical protein